MPNGVKIDAYNFELYRFEVYAFFETQCIYRHLQGNADQQRFTMRSGVLTGNDTGGTAQVAAAH